VTETFNKFQFMEQLRGVGMRTHDYRVLLTLMTYADRYGARAYPSITTLVSDCRMNEKTVAAALQRLEVLGLIRCVRRGGGGRGRTTEWQIEGVPTGLQRAHETPRGEGGLDDEETTRASGGFHTDDNPPANDDAKGLV
jgi:hypothetical protein